MSNENEEIKAQEMQLQIKEEVVTKKENIEIKNQAISGNAVEKPTSKPEKPKFKQEKIKAQKPKKKTWKKVFWAIVITLIIGIIGGAIGLYYAQEKTDFDFIVPSSLTKKTDVVEKKEEDVENNEAKIKEDVNEEKEDEVKNNQSEVLTIDEAYKKLDELYKVATDLYVHYPATYFQVNNDSHPSTSETAVEVTDYDKIINKYFTKSEKADYEEAATEIFIEEDDKVYMEPITGIVGLDFLGTVFTKVQISENEIKCVVDNIYNGSFDDMQVTSEGYVKLESTSIELKHVYSNFVIKKVNGNWKVDEFDFEGMK